MKRHYCPVEKTELSYEGECNWCGEKEQKPKNIAFVTTFDNYEEAEDHWNKLKGKEEYGIGVAGGKHFIIKNKAIDVIFETEDKND